MNYVFYSQSFNFAIPLPGIDRQRFIFVKPKEQFLIPDFMRKVHATDTFAAFYICETTGIIHTNIAKNKTLANKSWFTCTEHEQYTIFLRTQWSRRPHQL